MIDEPPREQAPEQAPESGDAEGVRATYGQHDFSPAAQRDRMRVDQHFERRPVPPDDAPDPYGEGGFAGGGVGQSGYGADFNQLQGSQLHERQVSERDYREAGTPWKSNR